MSKELEALEELDHLRKGVQYINQDESPAFISQYEEDIDIVENIVEQYEEKLKALEIIKEKRVEVRIIFHTTNAMEYNEKTRQYYDCKPLTQEQYELLKEELEK